MGRGGVARVARASGVSRPTIQQGLRELVGPVEPPERVRRVGGGRKALAERDPTLLTELEAWVDPDTRGDPMSPLRWTCKRTRHLAGALRGRGHRVGYRTVAAFLDQAGYSLPAASKTLEGNQHPDRDAQFHYLNDQVKASWRPASRWSRSMPRRRSWSAPSRTGGGTGNPPGSPKRSACTDFPAKHLGKAIPYGVYDVGRKAGWVTVGRDHDPATFAVASLRPWWQAVGVDA
ncbi:MAG: ISAzo13 family transposase [Chloroflexi bacterium]|nr:ISAzo13 family transposase [Chloroflexota bacterium]